MQIFPDLFEIEEAKKLKSEGFMDVNLDILHKSGNQTTIALSHYWKHESGDLMADPDMELRLDWGQKTVEALTFQQDPGIYQRVYPEPGKVAPQLKKDLNDFLGTWLTNIINQGHK